MNENILDIFADCTLNEQIDELLLENPEQIEVQERITHLQQLIESFHLSDELNDILEELVEAFITQGNVYANIAYRQGMLDAASLLKELQLLNAT